MTQQWTRDDLPPLSDIAPIAASTESYVYFAASVVLDAVVDHLNAHHPKPGHPMGTEAARWRRERDEALRKKGEMVDRAVRAENARDTAATRAEQLEKKLAKVMSDYQDVEDERDEWKARAEAEQARTAPSVSRADIEKAILPHILYPANGTQDLIDDVHALLSGSDPAVYVVRESDIAAVKVTEHAAGWSAESKHLVSGWGKGKHLSVDMDVDRYRAELLNALAVQRAIEAEQATDPVEAKARELYEVGNPGTVGMWDSIHEAFKDGYRRIARHVLGQEADQ